MSNQATRANSSAGYFPTKEQVKAEVVLPDIGSYDATFEVLEVLKGLCGKELEMRFLNPDETPAYTRDGEKFIHMLKKDDSYGNPTIEAGPHQVEWDTGTIATKQAYDKAVADLQECIQKVQKDFDVIVSPCAYLPPEELMYEHTNSIHKQLDDILRGTSIYEISEKVDTIFAENPEYFNNYPFVDRVKYYRVALYSVPESVRINTFTCATQGTFSAKDPSITLWMHTVVNEYLKREKRKYGNYEHLGMSKERKEQWINFLIERRKAKLPSDMEKYRSYYYDVDSEEMKTDLSNYPLDLGRLHYGTDDGSLTGEKMHFQTDNALKFKSKNGILVPTTEIRICDTTPEDIERGFENVQKVLLNAINEVGPEVPIIKYEYRSG